MRLPDAGPVVGARADLLAVRGDDLADVIARAPADRYVLRAGRLVARSSSQVEIATPAYAQTSADAATHSQTSTARSEPSARQETRPW